MTERNGNCAPLQSPFEEHKFPMMDGIPGESEMYEPDGERSIFPLPSNPQQAKKELEELEREGVEKKLKEAQEKCDKKLVGALWLFLKKFHESDPPSKVKEYLREAIKTKDIESLWEFAEKHNLTENQKKKDFVQRLKHLSRSQ